MKVVYFRREAHVGGQTNRAHCFYIPDRETLLVSESPVEPVRLGKVTYEHAKKERFSAQTPDSHEPFRWTEAVDIANGRKPRVYSDVTFSEIEEFEYEIIMIDEMITDTKALQELGAKVPSEFNVLRSRLYEQQKR